MSAAGPVDAAELRRVHVLADLADDDLAWLAAASELVVLAPGEELFTSGDPASWMYLFLEGTLLARRPSRGADTPPFRMHAGDVSGMLPFSRMTEFAGTGRAATPMRVARFPAARFGELLHRIPVLEQRLVAVMADRVRESTRDDQQAEKLMALGKLAAGLAHELNNPAAAARRAAAELRGRLAALEAFTVALAAACASPDAVGALDKARREALERAAAPTAHDALERSAREDELAEWLAGAGIDDAWSVAPTFADAGLTAAELAAALAELPDDARTAGIGWLEASLAADALLGAVEGAAGRISGLVGAVKSYTHVDQARAPMAADLREGVESTLAMFAHRVRDKRLTIDRAYSPALPRVPAIVGELNQVWSNLLDNAIDAAPVGGRVGIRVAPEDGMVVVEVSDDGAGVAPELQNRIWEPFFTTKAVGQGTGLGLDIARRIVVRTHGGEITLSSRPGDTRFTVRLPTTATTAFPAAPPDPEGVL